MTVNAFSNSMNTNAPNMALGLSVTSGATSNIPSTSTQLSPDDIDAMLEYRLNPTLHNVSFSTFLKQKRILLNAAKQKEIFLKRRDIFLKVAAIGLTTMALLNIQMGMRAAAAGAIAGVFSITTLLSECFLRKSQHFPSQTSNWLNTSYVRRKSLISFFGVVLTVNFIAGFIFSRLKFSVGQAVADIIKTKNPRFLVIVILIAPICEEFLFRGFLKERLEDACYLFTRFIHPLSDSTVKKVSNFGQAIIFGIAHVNSLQTRTANFIIFCMTGLFGFCLGEEKDTESTLITPISMHMSVNAAVTARLLIFGH